MLYARVELKPNLREEWGYYTQRWSTFTFANHLELSRIAAVLNILARSEHENAPAICDLGCGAGWSTSILGVFGSTLGVDLSDTTRAAERYPHCKFVSANILEWDHPKEAFDVVVSLEVIEHIERPLQARYIAIAHELLKPGGCLILTTPNARTMRAMAGGGKEWSNQPIEEWLSARELRSLLATRFQVREIGSVILEEGVRGSYRLVNSTKARRLLQLLGFWRVCENWALRNMYGLHLVAHAQKPARI